MNRRSNKIFIRDGGLILCRALALCSLLTGCGNPILKNALLGDDEGGRAGSGARGSVISKIEYKYRATAEPAPPSEGWNHSGWTALPLAMTVMNNTVRYLWYIQQTSYANGAPPAYAKGLRAVFGEDGFYANIADIEYRYQAVKDPVMPEGGVVDESSWNSGDWKELMDLDDWGLEKRFLWYIQKTTYTDEKPPAYTVGLQAIYEEAAPGLPDGTLIWKGKADKHLDPPEKNWVYYNTTDRNVYRYDETNGWVVEINGAMLKTNIRITGAYRPPSGQNVKVTFTNGKADTGTVDTLGFVWLDTVLRTSPPETFHTLRLHNPVEIRLGRFYNNEPIELNLDYYGNLMFRDKAVNPGDSGAGQSYVPIGTVGEFALINSNPISLSGKYMQTNDLNMLGPQPGMDPSVVLNWMPVGNQSAPFRGIFDGGSGTRRKIEHLYIDSSGNDNIGLFGYVEGTAAELRNITISSGTVKGRENTGGICGSNEGLITGCSNAASVEGGADYTGGITGQNSQTITASYNTGLVEGQTLVGGICGSGVTITVSHNKGEVRGSSQVGGVTGLVGENQVITACSNTGKVTGNGAAVGGVAGAIKTRSAIIASYNTGEVTITGAGGGTGGLAGEAEGHSAIIASYNSGGVTGSDKVGGLAGNITGGYMTITASYNTGAVTGDTVVGGIAGKGPADSSIVACYSTGEVKARHVGGLVGGLAADFPGTISVSYYLQGGGGGTPFGPPPAWPAPDPDMGNWLVGGSGTSGKYWKTLGAWDPRSYPRLYWE